MIEFPITKDKSDAAISCLRPDFMDCNGRTRNQDHPILAAASG